METIQVGLSGDQTRNLYLCKGWYRGDRDNEWDKAALGSIRMYMRNENAIHRKGTKNVKEW